MKHTVLDVPYGRFSSMCSDIDKWLRSSRSKLDIERYLYRKAWEGACRSTGDRAHTDPATTASSPPSLRGSE